MCSIGAEGKGGQRFAVLITCVNSQSKSIALPVASRGLGGNVAYAFNAGQMRACSQVREQRFFAEGRSEDVAILTERHSAARVDGLDDPTGLEGRLHDRLVNQFQCTCTLSHYTSK